MPELSIRRDNRFDFERCDWTKGNETNNLVPQDLFIVITSTRRCNAGPVTATSFLISFHLRRHPDDTRNMKLTTLKKLLKPSTVNFSGSSITDVAGDIHAHYGDIHNTSIQAGNQLKLYCSKGFPTLIVDSRLSLANHRRSCFNGCRLQFPGARSSSSMPSWNSEGSIGGDRKMGQGWK